ncbi:putative F-box protein At1g32420 [Solanum verrucosum]|uniref:putative F-box protein At1g32420 n=1 Tax=Solanum verrucosum TaxID=315347 RepID=UPI0020D1337F|nr:putative F-box protein At1g32420 [Solanum verrucosum]
MEDYNYIVACIPGELVIEILKKLPAKSLMKFKCVSKSFYSLISDPFFIESHQKSYITQFFVNRPRMTYYRLSKSEERDEDLATCPLEYLDQSCFQNLRYMQSTNGLVCLWNDLGDIAICNPFIKQHVFLPCQLHKGSTFYAIGFDTTTKRHKVFNAEIFRGGKLICSIFTIGIDKSWREVSSYINFRPTDDNCVCIDGVIYFVNNYIRDIVAFSVVDEKFIRRIPFPINEWPLRLFNFTPLLVETKGQVAILGHVYFNFGKIALYILNGTSEIEPWVKHTIELPLEFKKITHSFCFLLTTNPKGDILSIPEIKNPPLFLYDNEKKEWRIVARNRIYGQNFHIQDGAQIYLNLVESIWSLK